MSKLSIIITGMNEYPQVIYTIRSVYEEFKNRADFEIVYVDNFPTVLDQWNQGKIQDKSLAIIKKSVSILPEIRVLEYKDHLSHWVCKRKAVESSNADFFLFLDAHVVPSRDSLFNQYEYYQQHHEEMNGSLHVPLTYHILENHMLQYKMIDQLNKGFLGYSFTPHRIKDKKPYKVPCHSTCGCMFSRKIYEKFGGWPELMEAYGGGENLFNYTLSIIGMNKWLIPGKPLYHDGSPRSYSYNWKGLFINRLTAMYMIGDRKLAELFKDNQTGDKKILETIMENILSNSEVISQRKLIESQQVIDIYSWVKEWKDI